MAYGPATGAPLAPDESELPAGGAKDHGADKGSTRKKRKLEFCESFKNVLNFRDIKSGAA